MNDSSPSQSDSPVEGRPTPRVVRIDAAQHGSRRLLGGPPQTATMRSGLVVLGPSESVGRHSTGDREEVVVVLSGSGEMRTGDGATLNLAAPCIAYCPPVTEHDVVNTGREPLRYVYVVARAR